MRINFFLTSNKRFELKFKMAAIWDEPEKRSYVCVIIIHYCKKRMFTNKTHNHTNTHTHRQTDTHTHTYIHTHKHTQDIGGLLFFRCIFVWCMITLRHFHWLNVLWSLGSGKPGDVCLSVCLSVCLCRAVWRNNSTVTVTVFIRLSWNLYANSISLQIT